MLQYLKIRNLALLDEVELDLAPNFTAVTGETGAGKSILLGAFSMLAGSRAGKNAIREGADRAEVEAQLALGTGEAVDAALETMGLPPREDGALLLHRSIHREKTGRVRINGSVTTLANLQALGEQWIDFHGPGEPQKLFREREQLRLLDGFAQERARLSAYREAFRSWRALNEEIDELASAERLDPDEAAHARQQIERIDRAGVSEESIEALERDYARASRAQELIELASAGAAELGGEDGVTERLGAVVRRLEQLGERDAASEDLARRAREAMVELQDVAGELEGAAREYDVDEQTIAQLEERMNEWMDLRRRFGGSVEAVLAHRASLEEKLAAQGNVEEKLEAKRAEAERAETELRERAGKLREARRAAAGRLAERVNALLGGLGFQDPRFAIEIVDEATLREHGDCRCRFLFAPNAGQDAQPLNRIASSGEMARVMLALKSVLAEADATPVLVFDEVDANVGGEVGRAVGREMARLARGRQVFCVTHLPQVASLAEHHLVVEKTHGEASTDVTIQPLEPVGDDRLAELARMLGDRNSRAARDHARELMAADEPAES